MGIPGQGHGAHCSRAPAGSQGRAATPPSQLGRPRCPPPAGERLPLGLASNSLPPVSCSRGGPQGALSLHTHRLHPAHPPLPHPLRAPAAGSPLRARRPSYAAFARPLAARGAWGVRAAAGSHDLLHRSASVKSLQRPGCHCRTAPAPPPPPGAAPGPSPACTEPGDATHPRCLRAARGLAARNHLVGAPPPPPPPRSPPAWPRWLTRPQLRGRPQTPQMGIPGSEPPGLDSPNHLHLHFLCNALQVSRSEPLE